MGEQAGTGRGPERLPGVLTKVVDLLAGVDAQGLTQAECLEVVTRAEEIKAAAAAVQVRATARFVGERDADAAQAVARGEIEAGRAAARHSATRAEVALARRCSPGQADRHVGVAVALTGELSQTLAALTRGQISEWRAVIVARETACLSAGDRREVDRRLAPDLARLGERGLARAAQRAGLDLDQEALVRRRSRAVAARSVSVRPAPEGMAYLSVLGPLVEVVGAYAALTAAEKQRFVATGDPEVDAARAGDARGRGAWLADTALERLSGRAAGRAQPVEVALVMNEPAFLPALSTAATAPPARPRVADAGRARGTSVAGPQPAGEWVEVPGWGAVPPPTARKHLIRLLEEEQHEPDERGSQEGQEGRSGEARVWLRRLWTSPDGRDLVAMDSKRRFFNGALRRLLELRDPTCRIPWCDAPTRQIDHVHPAAAGGPSAAGNAMGLCQRHNLTKETPGWNAEVTRTGLDPGAGPHEVRLTTPTGTLDCPAPPLGGHARPAGPPPRPTLDPALIPGPDLHHPPPNSPLEEALIHLLHAA